MNRAVARAKAVFSKYAGIDSPKLPEDDVINMSALQVELFRWQQKNFNGSTLEHCCMGAAEEVGELCHAVLKHRQGIRGMDDKDAFKNAAGDAIADTAVFLIQAATILRLDFGELLAETASKVMERNWKNDER